LLWVVVVVVGLVALMPLLPVVGVAAVVGRAQIIVCLLRQQLARLLL
jgi:hypothetical protein